MKTVYIVEVCYGGFKNGVFLNTRINSVWSTIEAARKRFRELQKKHPDYYFWVHDFYVQD